MHVVRSFSGRKDAYHVTCGLHAEHTANKVHFPIYTHVLARLGVLNCADTYKYMYSYDSYGFL